MNLSTKRRPFRTKAIRIPKAAQEASLNYVKKPWLSSLLQGSASTFDLSLSGNLDVTRSFLSDDIGNRTVKLPNLSHDINPVATFKSARLFKETLDYGLKSRPNFYTLSPDTPSNTDEIKRSLQNDLRNMTISPVRLKFKAYNEHSEYSKLLKEISFIERLKGTPRRRIHKLKSTATVDAYAQPGSTDFFKAVKAGNIVSLRHILSLAPALIDTVDFVGQTALHWAAKRGNLVLAEFLLKHRANVNAVDIMHRTPLFMALRQDRLGLVELLLDNRADPYIKSINDKTAQQSHRYATKSLQYLQTHLRLLEKRRSSRLR